ncbi:hypothetical protein REPUB_Repub16aG0111000 [Reevesia pubescens]
MEAVTISLFRFLVIAATAICYCDGKSNGICIESERQALLKFKHDLIDRSNRLSSWVGDGDCGKWVGVVCHNLTGHVNELHLAPPRFPDNEAYDRSKLNGKINPSLLDLKHLSLLDLSNNYFSSIQIPEFFGSLGSLTYLNLSQTQFLGAIPHNLGNMSKLQYLDLRHNYWLFEAKNLQWVSGLSSLQYLDLSYVDLRKATDWLQVTSKLPSLLELHLSDCNLEDDLSSISVNSTNLLAVLDLSINKLSSVPTLIFSLHSLVSVDLSQNSLLGPIPDNFRNISFLEVLDLSFNSLNLRFNDFQGNISSAIGNLSSIIHLDLSYNYMLERVPTSLEHLCNLKEIDLSFNKIDQEVSEIIQSLSRRSLDRLESLNMANNLLFGRLTDELGQFKNPAYLSLYQNSISGPIPFSIGELSSLKLLNVLNLGNNNLTRIIPHSLEYTNLEVLNLRNNSLFGELPSTLQSSKGLIFLDLSENQFSGSIPAWIGDKLWGLVILSLRSNNFHSHIPRNICDLHSLQNLDLGHKTHNNISGAIPKCFSNLSAMARKNKTLNFVAMWRPLGNSLTGEIYEELGNLMGLRSLNLSGNLLTGKIPEKIGNMELLEALDLSMNLLYDEIPSSFSNLNFLNHLNLSYNNFTGKIPLGTQLKALTCFLILAIIFVDLFSLKPAAQKV